MDLQSLEAFVAVAELNSFSRAGEKLFLTQPAISKRISNLEKQLGTTLFDRIGRDIHLTEAGHLLKGKANKIINDIKDIQTSIGQIDSQDVKELAIASSHHIGLHYLGPILKVFLESYPQAKLDLKFMESELAIQTLKKRDIELAITTIPSPLPKEFTATHLWEDSLSFVVAEDHPLADRKESLRLNELAHLTAILPDQHTTTFQIIEKTFANHHIPLKRVISVNYLETIRSLVKNNIGWSLLPNIIINEGLKVINIDKVNLSRSLGIIQHKERTVSRGAQSLIEIACNRAEHKS